MNLKIHRSPSYMPEKVGRYHRKAIQVLKDLIRINKDRITGYEKAAHEDNKRNPGIRSVLYRLATESRSYVNELHAQVIRLGATPVTQETITGKIYLYWLDLRADFGCGEARTPGQKDDAAFLEACAYGEESLQKAYEKALDTGEGLPPEIFHLIEKQLWALQYNYPTFIKDAGNIIDSSI
ncbi:MAG TPA: PA2169 family four-helix-bundle protein [Puia sp.]|jgi:uncharacterized protein (TIGR02284 family)